MQYVFAPFYVNMKNDNAAKQVKLSKTLKKSVSFSDVIQIFTRKS